MIQWCIHTCHVLQIKEHFENSEYIAHGEPVDVQVTSDEETIPVTVQNVTGWSVEQLQVYIYSAWIWQVKCYINLSLILDLWLFIWYYNTQDSEVEVDDQITDEYKRLCTTTTFIVSSSQTSPDDMCVSVTISGGQRPHIVTVESKASRRCVCQVFYHREGVNCWKITFAFFSEHLLNVSNIIMCDAVVSVAIMTIVNS